MPGHAPSLLRRDLPGDVPPRALVLMLHGGRVDGLTAVDDRSASWRRSRWMMDQLTPHWHEAGTAAWLLRYAVRGWNERTASPPSPVPDARWALEQARAELPGVPVVLVGHSMGGRTGVAVADDPAVAGVVALAPWLPRGEPVEALRGKRLVAAHGRSDRITSPRGTRAFVRAAEPVAASAEFHDMGRVGHYMLRDVRGWNRFTLQSSLRLLAP